MITNVGTIDLDGAFGFGNPGTGDIAVIDQTGSVVSDISFLDWKVLVELSGSQFAASASGIDPDTLNAKDFILT